MSEFVLDFFEGKNLATIEKKKHSYLMIDGHDQADIYILKDGIVKTSIILSDGREFNIMYLKGFDVLSLLKDEIKKVTSASFHIRIESDTAVFYRVNRKLFSKFLSENKELRDYMDAYYLVGLFGREVKKGIFIDLQVTNDDIAGFCGVSTRNSVNRILRGLRQQGVITMVYHKILVLDVDYLKRYV